MDIGHFLRRAGNRPTLKIWITRRFIFRGSSIKIPPMSWEAYRWTAKTPAELYHTLGPHGVDELIRKSMSVCWRQLPADNHTLAEAQRAAREVFARNMTVWSRIKKPSPEAFFADLQPHEADHFMRQAMVTCWMMMPRVGGRDVSDVRRIVGGIFDRNMRAWEEDEAAFTGKAPGKPRPPRKPAKKSAKKTAKKAPPKKSKKTR
jgi:hypothetical protein